MCKVLTESAFLSQVPRIERISRILSFLIRMIWGLVRLLIGRLILSDADDCISGFSFAEMRKRGPEGKW
jgi:hypothetical protein